MQRIGLGTDKHLMAGGRKLVLGGVLLDFPKGLVGHSDGDVLTHAVIDALLGAAGLGDIGHHFPDTDPKWKGADSIEMLKLTVDILKNANCRPVNVDCTIHLQQPKLGWLKQEMVARLAEAMGVPRHMVNVKAKSGEGTGEIGRGEAIEAFAIALVEAP